MIHPEVDRLLATQFGVVGQAQLVELCISTRTVARARSDGSLLRILPGVFQTAASPPTFESKAMAAQLYTAPDGALSGPTAARVFGLRGMPAEWVSVMMWRRLQADIPAWLRVTRSSWFDPWQDVVMVRGCLRVVRPLRMLLTLAELFNDFRFERAAEDAWHLGLVEPGDAAEYLEQIRRQGRTGVDRFERWLKKTAERSPGRPTSGLHP